VSGIWTIQENKRRKAAVNNVVEVITRDDGCDEAFPSTVSCGTSKPARLRNVLYVLRSTVCICTRHTYINTTIPTYERTEYDTRPLCTTAYHGIEEI
jgi:hypothetical protein